PSLLAGAVDAIAAVAGGRCIAVDPDLAGRRADRPTEGLEAAHGAHLALTAALAGRDVPAHAQVAGHVARLAGSAGALAADSIGGASAEAIAVGVALLARAALHGAARAAAIDVGLAPVLDPVVAHQHPPAAVGDHRSAGQHQARARLRRAPAHAAVA